MPLSLIYSDLFQYDKDLCNIFAALQFQGCPMSASQGVVAKVVATHSCNEAPTVKTLLALGIKPSSATYGTSGKYPSILLRIKPSPVTPDPSEKHTSISLDDQTEVRDPWYVSYVLSLCGDSYNFLQDTH